MKKIIIYTLTVLLLSLMTIVSPSAAEKVTLTDALSLALGRVPGKLVKARLSRDVYEIEVKTTDGQIKKVYVDRSGNVSDRRKSITMAEAVTMAMQVVPGEVVGVQLNENVYHIDVETPTGDTEKLRIDGDGNIEKVEEEEEALAVKEGKVVPQPRSGKKYVSMEEAAGIALEIIPGSVFKIQFVRGVYDIDVKTPSGEIQKVFIDLSGNVVKERENITEDEAVSITLQEVKGEVEKVEKKKDHYIVHVRKNADLRYHVYVDAENGEIIKKQKARIYKYNWETMTWSD